jgi:hypothetical protein
VPFLIHIDKRRDEGHPRHTYQTGPRKGPVELPILARSWRSSSPIPIASKRVRRAVLDGLVCGNSHEVCDLGNHASYRRGILKRARGADTSEAKSSQAGILLLLLVGTDGAADTCDRDLPWARLCSGPIHQIPTRSWCFCRRLLPEPVRRARSGP